MKDIRIWRSPKSAFGEFREKPIENEEETITAENVYTDDVFKEIAQNGFNAIWVHGFIHHLVSTNEFPEFGVNAETHLDALRKLIARGNKHGVKTFIYMQPPQAIPLSDTTFWQAHADVAGQIEQKTATDGSGTYKRTLIR